MKLVGEGRNACSRKRLEQLRERSRRSTVGRRLSRQLIDHGAGCEVELVEQGRCRGGTEGPPRGCQWAAQASTTMGTDELRRVLGISPTAS